MRAACVDTPTSPSGTASVSLARTDASVTGGEARTASSAVATASRYGPAMAWNSGDAGGKSRYAVFDRISSSGSTSGTLVLLVALLLPGYALQVPSLDPSPQATSDSGSDSTNKETTARRTAVRLRERCGCAYPAQAARRDGGDGGDDYGADDRDRPRHRALAAAVRVLRCRRERCHRRAGGPGFGPVG